MEMASRRLAWLRNAVLGAFVAALCAGVLLPLYTDEVGWRLQERAAFDGVDKLFSQLCGPNTLAHPPFWMMPVRWYSLINMLFPEPIYVRLSGILYALVWTAMLLGVIRRAVGGARAQGVLSILAIGFLSLGTVPLLLIWSRPEQPIVLAFTGAVLLALKAVREAGDTPRRSAWLRSLGILGLALIALSYHVKAVATVPLFLACLVFATRGRGAIVPRVVVGIVLAGATAWAAHYWVDRFACTADAALQSDYVRTTGPALVSATSRSQLSEAITRASNDLSIFIYPGLGAPRAEPMSNWLPGGRISVENSFRWFLAIVSAWTMALVASLFCLASDLPRQWGERRIDSRAALAVVMIGTAIAWSAAGFNNVYEAKFGIPLMVLGVILALSGFQDTPYARAISGFAGAVAVAGLASIMAVAAIYGPSLVASTRQGGYAAGQPYSVSAFNYAKEKGDIVAAGRACGIGDPTVRRMLVLDDMTYFAFMRSRLPEHRGGVFLPWIAHDPLDYLRSVRSGGMIVSCEGLPSAIRDRTQRVGKYCCMGPGF